MNFNVLVSGAPFDTLASFKAAEFCTQAMLSGHQISQVFFYQAAVTQANDLIELTSDEYDGKAVWQTIAKNHGVPLVICISAGERRGVIADDQALELDKPFANLAEYFTVAGLGVFHSASLSADRTVVFK